MSNQFVVDSNFDKNITNSYFLSIQITLDGFSFCVLDPISNEYILFFDKSLSLNQSTISFLENELSENEYLQMPYQKVFILYNTKYNTLIPSSLFQEEKKNQYLNFCFNKNKFNEELTYCNKIKMADSYCIFSIPKSITDILNNKFQSVFYYCSTTPFIETALLNTNFNNDKYQIYINIQNSFFDTIAISGNNLKLHNSFKFHDKKEFLYYTLLIFEQLKLSNKSSKVFLIGKIKKTDEIYTLLKKYIKHVEIIKDSKHFKFSAIFKNISLQDHINLINIPLCV